MKLGKGTRVVRGFSLAPSAPAAAQHLLSLGCPSALSQALASGLNHHPRPLFFFFWQRFAPSCKPQPADSDDFALRARRPKPGGGRQQLCSVLCLRLPALSSPRPCERLSPNLFQRALTPAASPVHHRDSRGLPAACDGGGLTQSPKALPAPSPSVPACAIPIHPCLPRESHALLEEVGMCVARCHSRSRSPQTFSSSPMGSLVYSILGSKDPAQPVARSLGSLPAAPPAACPVGFGPCFGEVSDICLHRLVSPVQVPRTTATVQEE